MNEHDDNSLPTGAIDAAADANGAHPADDLPDSPERRRVLRHS